MIPLHDDIPSRRVPVVMIGLIVLNVLVFLVELGHGRALDLFLSQWALIPAHVTRDLPALAHGTVHLATWLPMLTSMFLHGGWLHLGGNMLFLGIFGDNVEDRMGHVGFFFFYLLAGIGAAVLQVALHPHGLVPMVGASGAIAGVLGAYMVLYPDSRVLTLVPLGFFLTTIRIRAFWFLLIWFGLQALRGVTDLAVTQGDVGGVAWWAHVGGFVVGVVAGLALRGGGSRRPPPRSRYADRWYSNR